MTSLRDVGYDFPTAAADLIDNSVSAGARNVDIGIHFSGLRSYILIADDGCGMTERELDEALRFGTRREYDEGDLGRYGLGLKTASISQGRRVTVVTRRAPKYARLYSRTLDLDHVDRTDRWEILDARGTCAHQLAAPHLSDGPGTVVVIDHLDRILPDQHPESGWARRRFSTLRKRTGDYLGMAFHRLLERPACSKVTIRIDGRSIDPWNPFAPGEGTVRLPKHRLEVDLGSSSSKIGFQGHILPPRDRFSSPDAFERLGGPKRWNRQQGLYIYRADRLIQSGGWCGLRAADEHTKLARAAIDFGTDLDEFFRIDVAKMRVALPAQVRGPLGRPVRDLCQRAQIEYRSGRLSARQQSAAGVNGVSRRLQDLALALNLAACEVGESEALERIMVRLRASDPAIAAALGW